MDAWETVRQMIMDEKVKKSHFAKKMGISRSTLDNWLNDTTSPTRNDLKKMSGILDNLPLPEKNNNNDDMKDSGAVYREIVEGRTPYLLIHTSVLEKHEKQLLNKDVQIQSKDAQILSLHEIIKIIASGTQVPGSKVEKT